MLTVRNEHAVALLADGVAKGYTDIKNLDAAYEKAKEIAENAVNDKVRARDILRDAWTGLWNTHTMTGVSH